MLIEIIEIENIETEEVEANATESEDKGRKVGEHVEHENENVEKYEREKGK